MKIKNIFLFFLILLTLSHEVYGDKPQKTIILVVDRLDFNTIEEVFDTRDISVGLMNVKTGSIHGVDSQESFFMTIASGKRVKVEKGLFKEVTKKEDGTLKVEGYGEIKGELYNRYVDFSREINFFGEYFKEKGIVTGYIGNDSSSLIPCDEDGIIRYGYNDIKYENKWLQGKTGELLKNVDVLVVSYDLRDSLKRKEMLKKYISRFSMEYDIIVFPKEIKGDIDIRWNTSLVPLVYLNPKGERGILASDTTRRIGVVTNLDIFPTIAFSFNNYITGFVGKRINIIQRENPIQEIKINLIEYLNFNILKYLIHGVVILLELYVIINLIRKKEKDLCRYKILMNGILIGIFLSFVLGIFRFQRNITLYLFTLLIISFLLSRILTRRKYNILGIFAVLTNIFILYGIFINNEIIYNSYIGYNNIVAGGRFYGLNNETMGVLMATSIFSYFYIKEKIKGSLIRNLILLFYFLLIIVSLSGRFGANLGGYLTAIALLIIMVYVIVFNRAINRKNIILLALVGLGLFLFNLLLELQINEKSHIGNILIRTEVLGYRALLNMIIEKVKQFLFMIVIPPWSIILIGQIYFIKRFYPKISSIKETFIILVVSAISLVVNDTGVIAFTYMNTYLLNRIVVGLDKG